MISGLCYDVMGERFQISHALPFTLFLVDADDKHPNIEPPGVKAGYLALVR